MVSKQKFWSILILLMWSAGAAHGAGSSRIIPFSGRLAFPAESGQDAHPISIKSPSGTPLYEASLEPDYDVAHHTVVLTLVLHKSGDDEDAPNLFDPTGRVHGAQKYTFAASDFSRGVEKSIYGKQRTLTIVPLGLEVRVDVETANVNSLMASAGNEGFEFKQLVLQVDIRNDCLFSLDKVSGQVPRFEDYRVGDQPQRAPATVAISSADARRYRTKLREGAAKGPNFAGHYTIVVWGCGSSCNDWAIVDAVSGRVTFIDDLRAISGTHVEPEKSGWPQYLGLRFRRDSNLLVVVGAPREDESREGIAYYKWNGKSLDRLRFISRADLCSQAE